MSFFDEDDEPTRRQPRPRPRRARPAGPAGADAQQIWVRRGVAAAFFLLVFVLLLVGIRACQSSAQKNALREYNREVAALVQQSDGEVGQGFFELLQQAGSESPEDLQTGISGYKEQSETILDQAERLDVPDEMLPAHRSLLIALEQRRDGLQYIAERIGQATGDQGDAADEAIEQIAGQMQGFLASDVLIAGRVTPMVKRALDEAEVTGQEVVATRRFLRNIDWLQPSSVASALGVELSGGGSRSRNQGDPNDGLLHGTGLTSVSVGDVTLQPGTANRVPVSDDLVFNVKFANQGEADEFDVRTVVRLEGPNEIRAEKTVETVAQGAEADVALQLPRAPTAGEVYTVTAEVRKVPGEEKTDNNKQTYQVLFTQG